MLSSNHLPGPVVPFAQRRLAVVLPCALGRDATPVGAVEADEEGRGALQLEPVGEAGSPAGPDGPDTGYTARTDTPLNEIPRPLSITTGQQMRERKVDGVGDAPSYTAGEERRRGPHEVASLAGALVHCLFPGEPRTRRIVCVPGAAPLVLEREAFFARCRLG